MAISRWRAPRESEREATRHKLEVGSSIPGHLGVRALFFTTRAALPHTPLLTSPLYGKLSTRMQNPRSFPKLGYRKYDFFSFFRHPRVGGSSKVGT